MSLIKAIETAVEMEAKIRDLYADARDQCDDEAGRRIFDTLRKDEQYHLDYLNRQLAALDDQGRLEDTPIKSFVPDKEQIKSVMDHLEKKMAEDDHGLIQQMLSKALSLEVQTSDFYREMSVKFEGDARKMFSRFLEIEASHILAVQYELDYVQKTGYWLGFKEFDME